MPKVILKRSVKTAVSLPAETFRQAETLRRRLGRSRSRLYAEALQAYLRGAEVSEREERYAEGYRRIPEDAKEEAALTKLASKALQGEDW